MEDIKTRLYKSNNKISWEQHTNQITESDLLEDLRILSLAESNGVDEIVSRREAEYKSRKKCEIINIPKHSNKTFSINNQTIEN